MLALKYLSLDLICLHIPEYYYSQGEAVHLSPNGTCEQFRWCIQLCSFPKIDTARTLAWKPLSLISNLSTSHDHSHFRKRHSAHAQSILYG